MTTAQPHIALRDATLKDAGLLFEWVNSPDSLRTKGATHTPIPWRTHTAWLAARLDDPDCTLKIIEHDGRPAGQLRLEPSDGSLEVDIYVVPASRGHGIAASALRHAFAHTPGWRYCARVRHDNTASQALFRGLGFSETSRTHRLILIELVQ